MASDDDGCVAWLTDLLGNPFTFSFYIVDGDGYLLVGNDLLQEAQILNDEGLVVISQVGNSTTDNSIYFFSYHSPGNRTHLFGIPITGTRHEILLFLHTLSICNAEPAA